MYTTGCVSGCTWIDCGRIIDWIWLSSTIYVQGGRGKCDISKDDDVFVAK